MCTKHDIVMFGKKRYATHHIYMTNMISGFHGIMEISYQVLHAYMMTVDI